MKNGRFDRATAWASAVLILAALTLAPAPAVAADHGPEAREPAPMLQTVKHLWAELTGSLELLFSSVTAGSDEDPAEATATSDDGDLETSILNGPKIDPNG